MEFNYQVLTLYELIKNNLSKGKMASVLKDFSKLRQCLKR